MSKIFFKGATSDRENRPLRAGDRVKYTVSKRLSPTRAIIHFLGKKVIADIPVSAPSKGMAIVRSVGEQIELYFPPKEEKTSISLSPISNERRMLLESGIKADEANVSYLKTTLRLIGDKLDNQWKAFLLSLIGKSIYLSPERIMNLMKPYWKNILLWLSERKKANTSVNITDKLIKLSSFRPEKEVIDTSLYSYLKSNGNIAIWILLFDTLTCDDEKKDAEEIETLILRLLLNKDKNSVLIPFFMLTSNSLRFVQYSEDGKNASFKAFGKDGEEIVEISLNPENERFRIELSFKSASLYNAFVKRKGNLTTSLKEKDIGTPFYITECLR